MNGFRETARHTNGRTNEGTDKRDSLGLQRLRRETKNINVFEENDKKPDF